MVIQKKRQGNAFLSVEKRLKMVLENGDDEAIQDYLGLEDDYIFDILD